MLGRNPAWVAVAVVTLLFLMTPVTWAVDGNSVVSGRCTTCHSIDVIQDTRKTTNEWAQTVDREIARGANLNDEERDAAVYWLSTNFNISPSANVPANDPPDKFEPMPTQAGEQPGSKNFKNQSVADSSSNSSASANSTSTLAFNQQARTGVELWHFLLTGSSLIGSGLYFRRRQTH